MGDDRIRVVRSAELRASAGGQPPGILRQEAFASEGRWAGVVRAGPGAVSGWHHHGEYDTYFYVLAGTVRLESGPDGRSVVEAAAGDFAVLPKGAIHRESNPEDGEQVVVVFRVGSGGPPVVPVEGPES